MELVDKSRRSFKLECDKGWEFDFGDVSASGGTIRFQRPAIHETHRFVWDSVASCKLWILKHKEAMTMDGFVANKRVDKNLYDVKAMPLKMNDREWEKVAKYMLNPERFDPENDVKVFRTYLANNFRDRDGERFPKAVLNSFNKSIVGKSKLIGHNWGPPGDGRFYYSKLEAMTVDDALEFVGAQPDKKFREHLEFIEERDGGIFWLVPRYYMINITPEQQQAILNIEAGIWKDMSIGFRAPAKYAIFADGKEAIANSEDQFGIQQDDRKNQIVFLEYRNTKDVESEALEGSHVFLGSQYGAQTTKSFDVLEQKIDSLEKVIGELGNSEIGKKSKTRIDTDIEEEVDEKQSVENKENKDNEEKEISTDELRTSNDEENKVEWVDIETIEDEEIKYYVTELDQLIEKESD